MGDGFLQEIIQLNFLPLGILLFLCLYLWFNRAYESRLSKFFFIPMILLAVLMVDDNIDYYFLSDKNVGLGHVLTAVVGYNVRIALMVSLIMIELRDEKRKVKMMVLIPGIVNLLITCCAFFTKWVFWYGADGKIVRGPLSYTPHVISFLYAILLFSYGIYVLRFGRWEECIIVCLATSLSVFGTLVETIYQLRGILIGVVAMDATFFYLYFHIENFKMDILTGTFNRVSFYADSQKLNGRSDVTVFSIDLNDLKKINDTQGHAEGDKAICNVAHLIQKHLAKGCRLYRVGGDEFVIICTGTPEKAVTQMEQELQTDMKASPYVFAVGKSSMKKGEDFEEVYRRADQEMYVHKKELKKARQD